MEKALVIFSGGQDSTTSLYWAKHKFDIIEAITFNYGQKHLVEVECAKQICILENVRHTIIDISFLGQIVDSALTSNGDVNAINDYGLPASFVPNRNQLFITLAHAYAQKVGANNLVTGVCQTDYSGYPDCREAYIRAIEWATNMGSKSNINIHTPLMYLTKEQTWMLAEKENCLLQVVEHSHTCYNGDRTHLHEWGYGCGNCPACELRMKGFFQFKNSLK